MTAKYVIVGNGPAGVAAAEAIRARDSAGEILILGDERAGFYSRPGLAYLLTGSIPEKQLYSRSDETYRRLRVRRGIARAVGLDVDAHRLALEGGQQVGYDRLLLAVGARAIRPGIPGINLPEVVTLDNLDDARSILKIARRTRRAVVVGGGITAVELAEGLASQGVEVHYLLRKERYWGAVLDPHESALVEERLEEEGIRLHRNTELSQVLAKRGGVVGVELVDGRRLACGMLAVAIGIRPKLELAQAGGLATDRGVLTDEYLRTSDPDIFAAGDVAEVLDPERGVRVLDSLWSTALSQGAAAGGNMAGAGEPYPRGIPFNVTRVGGVTVTLIGTVGSGVEEGDLVSIARGDSEAWRGRVDAFAIEAEAERSRIRILVGRDRLVGAVVMGDQTWSRPLQRLIAGRVGIADVRPILVDRPERMLGVLEDLWKEAQRAA
ncbi:MAG TPA: FAD-dependent oxidoreductase [Anaerolineales bacterium]|nr:FAD-dependent oxidoreductase [Anaerolineales bacterium]